MWQLELYGENSSLELQAESLEETSKLSIRSLERNWQPDLTTEGIIT